MAGHGTEMVAGREGLLQAEDRSNDSSRSSENDTQQEGKTEARVAWQGPAERVVG